MAMEYVMLYHSYLKSVALLNDAERGRLFTSLLEYSMTGAEPELRGNEKFVWPMMKEQIDRDKRNYQKKCETLRNNANKRWDSQGDHMQMDADGCRSIQMDAEAYKEKEKEKAKEKEKEKEKAKDIPSAEPPILALPLADGSAWDVLQADVDDWSALYPAVDVMQALRSMLGWLNANPRNRKTRNGIRRFVNGWLAKEQNRAPIQRQSNAASQTGNVFAELVQGGAFE